MKSSYVSSPRRLVILSLTVIGALIPLEAAYAQKIDHSKLDNAAQRSRNAAKVLNAVISLPGESIPKELINRAKAIAVFPDVDKVSFLLQKAMQGYGVICSRLAGGWSPPVYYSFGMAEMSLTLLGVKKPDVVILFMTDKAMERFEKGGIRFKGEMIGFAGPVGELTNEKENSIRAANVIVYTLVDGKVKGMKIDAGFLGDAAINPDNNINKAIYGLKGREVLLGKAPQWPSVLPSVSEFQNALTSLSKP
jgi:lipid-binding SYLF domain-containing protein